MSRNADDRESKQRILDAAARHFAAKGFDGARVDEIAKLAGVNKALIYYYFKSKDELLEVLCRETLDHILSFMTTEALGGLEGKETESFKLLLSRCLDELEEHEDVIRVILMESLKRSSDTTLVFSLIKDTLARMFASGRDAGLGYEQSPSTEVMEFFTGIMPLLSYVAYHNMWMERFNLSEPELRGLFIDSFIGTHVAFSAKLYRGQG